MPAHKKDPDDLCVRVTFSMPPDQLERLKRYCDQHDRQQSRTIRTAVVEYLERHEKREED